MKKENSNKSSPNYYRNIN